MSQYIHDRWGADTGFPGGAVFSICQSQDGYLWIGTERGLVRFDGSDFTLIQHPISDSAPIGAVRGLVADVEGNLWLRLNGPHLLRYRDGRFEDAVARFGLQDVAFTAMGLDAEGELLLWGPQVRLLRFRDGEFKRSEIAEDNSGIVIATAEMPDHTVWMGTRDTGLVQVDRGHSKDVLSLSTLTSVNTLLAASDDRLWIGTNAGLEFWNARDITNAGLPNFMKKLQILALAKDREGSVWVGTSQGLVRIAPELTVSAGLIQAKSSNAVTAVYQDRDGDLWFGGSRGLERLRDGVFTGYSAAQRLPAENDGPIYVDSEGRTWFAPASGGIYWLKGTNVHKVGLAGLDKEVIYSIGGGSGEVWIGRQHGGLTVLTRKGTSFVQRTYTQAEGLAQNSVYSVHRNQDGTVWAGTVSAGVSRLSNGTFTNYSTVSGFASTSAFSTVEGSDGTMWFATPDGLESLVAGHWKNYSIKDGLPSANVRSIFEDSRHVLWIATSGGLAMFASGKLEVPHSLTDSLREEILGITEDREGSLWIVTPDHVLQANRDRLLDGSLKASEIQSYGTEDGLPVVEGVRRDRSVLTDSSGRVWISMAHGLAMTDPTRTARNAVPVRVRIESLSTGGTPVSFRDEPKLAAGTHSITFNYADSNLTARQRIHYRYRLDGSDQRWSNDVAVRQVVYTNLGPGSYRFRIVASNAAGIWNGPETIVRFVVEPAFWQMLWFRTLGVACFVGMVVFIYRLRMSQMTQRLNIRFQDRLAERTRIAQELHDTLLQGVLSASLQLDVVESQTPRDSPTIPMLRRVLQLMGKVTEEGRSALRELRVPAVQNLSLETALSRIPEEFALESQANYRIVAQGMSGPVRPIVRDEVYRISREAVVNAFLHARANNIEVEVEYASRFFRVLVRDDGRGIDPQVLNSGREGHWGLPGMRERSESIGASLRLRSRVGAGTEVELTIPGVIAFETQARRLSTQWRSWLNRERFDSHSNTTEEREDK